MFSRFPLLLIIFRWTNRCLFQERIDIETNYNKCLQIYYDKWSDHVGGLAKSAIQAVWKDILEESMELQRLHANVRDRICDEVSHL